MIYGYNKAILNLNLNLYPHCRGAKDLMTPILAGLMECDTRRMLDFPTFFTCVKAIYKVHVFSAATATMLHVYIGNDEK